MIKSFTTIALAHLLHEFLVLKVFNDISNWMYPSSEKKDLKIEEVIEFSIVI